MAKSLPILRETALLIADPQVRYVGTLGGNVANGDPGNDMPAVMHGLGATYRLEGPAASATLRRANSTRAPISPRSSPAKSYRRPHPAPPAGHGYAYQKLKRKIGDYATAAAAWCSRSRRQGRELLDRPHQVARRRCWPRTRPNVLVGSGLTPRREAARSPPRKRSRRPPPTGAARPNIARMTAA